MELELKKACLDAYETGGEIVVTQEETAETIVPDYCPDIARIIKTNGILYIHSRDLREGRATVSGTVRVTVLYVPEGEGGIRTLEFAIPFSAETDHRSLQGASALTADTDIELLETRMLNPRKVFTHCKFITRVIGYEKAPLCFCTDLETEEKLCLEKKQEQQRANVLTRIIEKDFTFTEEITFSPGKSGAVELISARVNSTVTETKIIGSKLVFKGIFVLSLLYRTTDGGYASYCTELPFSQIMEADGISEKALCTIRLQLTGSDFQIDSGESDGREIAVTLYLHATALLREEYDLTLLSDLYSTAYEVSYEAKPLTISCLFETMSRRQTVREVLEIGVVADSVLSVSANCGQVSVHREGQNTVLRAPTIIRALYLDEGGVPLLAERSADVSCQLELPEDCRISAVALCAEDIQTSLGDRGIEVRFPVDFRMEVEQRIKKVCITSAELDTNACKDMAGAPSLVLRCLGKQETAWDLAKKYNTTIPAILSANLLETEADIPQEKLLLIPRKRA